MGMVVRTNTMAINAYRQLGMNNSAVAKSLEKLASGYRINRAGDDAAGLAISEKMKAQITGLETASSNAQDGISLIQTAEGNLSEVHDMLNRMVELATKSANGTYTQTERDALQDEVDQLLSEIDRISKSANFNGAKLLDGSLAGVNAIDAKNVTTGTTSATITQTGKDLGVVKTADNHVNSDEVKAEKEPGFAIDLADFKVNLPTNTAAATFTVSLGSIGGKSVSFFVGTATGTQAFTAANAKAAVFTQAQNAPAADKVGSDIAGLFNGTLAVIGNDVYSVAANGSKLTFTYAGQKNGEALVAKADEGGKPTADSLKPTGNVSVTVGSLAGENRVNCHITEITDGQKGDEIVRSGAKLELTQDIIDRGSLTIGDTTFTFDNTKEADDAATPLGGGGKTTAVTIGTKGLEGDALLQSVTEQMSHCTVKIEKDGTEYDFTVGRGANLKTIEIEEKVQADADDYGKFTEAELQDAFSQSETGTFAQSIVTLNSKNGEFVNIKEGNSLKIGGTTYTFTKEGTGTNEVRLGETAADTLTNLKNKIGNAATVDTTNGKITITASTTTADAPEVSYTAASIDAGGLTLQIGDTADIFNKMTVAVNDMSANGLGIGGLDITKEDLASSAIDTIKTAINTVSTARAGMGALQNRLEHTINNLDVAAENLSAANSRIRDTDMAKEMMNYTKMNVLVQSAQAMLAQANQQPQSVLQLLQ